MLEDTIASRTGRTAALALLSVLALAASAVGAQDEKNSTRKIRPEPGEVAARAGSAIAWQSDVDAALALAKESGKPVFWYVPTVAGTFMDRKTEIDRYMLAGPFSWPRTVDLLGANFVSVRQAATKELKSRFGIDTVDFIEPGYVVLSPEGQELARLDSLTTFHPRWFAAPLEKIAGVEPNISNWPGSLQPKDLASVPGMAAIQRAIATNVAVEASDEVELRGLDKELVPEALWIFGVLAHQASNDAWGRSTFERLASKHPTHVLGQKAAMELEGHGPFLRGFEVYGELAPAVLAKLGRGTQSPTPMRADDVWRASTNFLAALQNDGGGFHDSTYDFGGTDGMPNVFVAITAIAAIGLDHALDQGLPVARAAALARSYVLDDKNLNVVDTDEQIWAHIYRLRYLAARMDADAEARAWALVPARAIAKQLVDMQNKGGAWYHEYPNPFVTASCLIALADVERHGVKTDRAVIDRGLDSLESCRTADGAFTYGMQRGAPRAEVAAGVGRSPTCELALVLFGRSDQERLLAAVAASFEHEEPFLKIQKYDNHTRFHAFGGFFFWYGLCGRIEAIAHLDDAGARRTFANRAEREILALPEIDGCFVDSHELGRAYGTGMALWSLSLLGRVDH